MAETSLHYYKVDILISGRLITKMDLDSEFRIEALGEKKLRGRDEKIELFTVYN